jgi:histidinol dehydrogenase
MSDAQRNVILSRSSLEIDDVKERVKGIITDIKVRNDIAIVEFMSNQLGRPVQPRDMIVGEEQIIEAYKNLNQNVLTALKHLIKNITKFHLKQKPKSWRINIEDGVVAGEDYYPLNSAGLYVPAGKASYPSVAAMLVIPAKVAGVKRIAVASPPVGGVMKMDPATLVAAHMAGATEFYTIGGAHAIAAFALGTNTIPKMDIVAGPGGPYTYAAKSLVKDYVRVDSPAGPSEGMVLSDGDASPHVVAWNVLNEEEHGPDSAGILVTTSFEFATKVQDEMEKALVQLPAFRREFIIENAKKYSGIIVCDNLDEAVDFINAYAPEHLSIESKNASRIFKRYKGVLKNYGTLTINTPFSAGNYGIGPNSTLPTNGYARIFSGLGVTTFIKSSTYEMVNKTGWKKMIGTVRTLADYEGFPSHRMAMEVRYNPNNI